MKNSSLIILTMMCLSGTLAYGGVTDGAGTWVGRGAIFNEDGEPTGKYRLKVVNTKVGDHEITSNVTVTLSNGTQYKSKHRAKDTSENGFVIEMDDGHGGGYCLGAGLCQLFIDLGAGHSFAIAQIIDGKNRIRLLKTELQGGKAVRFFRDKLVRIKY